MLTRLAEALGRLFEGNGEVPVCAARSFTLTVRCSRCGEIIPIRIDRDHELQSVFAEDAEEGDPPLEYVLRKEIVGEDCQNLIRFTIRFNCNHGQIESQIEGGEFVERRLKERSAVTVGAELSR